MSAPVTRGELHEALGIWGGALRAEIAALRGDVSRDIARHTQAILEEMRRIVGIVDEPYEDLPARVGRLEAKVFAKRRR